MWLYVDSPQHYFIDDLCDYRGFLRQLHLILYPEDSIVFSSYGSRPDVRAFLEHHQLEPDEHVIHERERLAICHQDNPEAFAVRCAANPDLVNGLLLLLQTSVECIDFCTHIIAYGPRGPLLSFHDAFQSDPLIVSSCIPRPQIEQFCRALGVTYKLQDRKQFYDWST
jgi:hypothetical protein